jgi:hypothetical protein
LAASQVAAIQATLEAGGIATLEAGGIEFTNTGGVRLLP